MLRPNIANNAKKSSIKANKLIRRDCVQKFQDEFQDELVTIPQNWALTPVKDKRPLRPNWHREVPIQRGNLKLQILQGTEIPRKDGSSYTQEWNGFGVRSGAISGGLLTIDQDGPGAFDLLTKMSGGDLPKTVSWTSGKDARQGLAYQLSSETQALIKEHFPNGWSGKKMLTSPGELHFRYDGCQMVLPPSVHPETGKYRWINAPEKINVAPAPQWLENQIRQWVFPALEENHQPTISHPGCPSGRLMSITNEFFKWTGPGQSNKLLGRIARHAVFYEGITKKEQALARCWEIAKVNGYYEHASVEEQTKDPEHLDRWLNWQYSLLKDQKQGYTGLKRGSMETNEARQARCLKKAKQVCEWVREQFSHLASLGWTAITELIQQGCKALGLKGFGNRVLFNRSSHSTNPGHREKFEQWLGIKTEQENLIEPVLEDKDPAGNVDKRLEQTGEPGELFRVNNRSVCSSLLDKGLTPLHTLSTELSSTIHKGPETCAGNTSVTLSTMSLDKPERFRSCDVVFHYRQKSAQQTNSVLHGPKATPGSSACRERVKTMHAAIYRLRNRTVYSLPTFAKSRARIKKYLPDFHAFSRWRQVSKPRPRPHKAALAMDPLCNPTVLQKMSLKSGSSS